MKRRGTLARLVLNRVAGIAVCAFAVRPIMEFIDIAIEAMWGRALTGFSTTLWSQPFPEFLMIFVLIAALMLPMVGTIAFGMYLLARLGKDSFLIATVSGALVGYVAITLTLLIAIGKAPGLDFDSPSNTHDLANMLFITSATSALYWVVSIRRERHWRRIDMQDELALRAME